MRYARSKFKAAPTVGNAIVSPSGATGVFRAATGVAAAPQKGANPSFATGDDRGAKKRPQRRNNASLCCSL